MTQCRFLLKDKMKSVKNDDDYDFNLIFQFSLLRNFIKYTYKINQFRKFIINNTKCNYSQHNKITYNKHTFLRLSDVT